MEVEGDFFIELWIALEVNRRRGFGYEAAVDLLGSDGARDGEGKGKRQRERAR